MENHNDCWQVHVDHMLCTMLCLVSSPLHMNTHDNGKQTLALNPWISLTWNDLEEVTAKMGSEPISLRGLMLLQSALAAQLGWRTAAHQPGSVSAGASTDPCACASTDPCAGKVICSTVAFNATTSCWAKAWLSKTEAGLVGGRAHSGFAGLWICMAAQQSGSDDQPSSDDTKL